MSSHCCEGREPKIEDYTRTAHLQSFHELKVRGLYVRRACILCIALAIDLQKSVQRTSEWS